jgi:hypothetical protein
MSWFVRLDRFGSGHLVRSQDKDNSCAMASILMVNFKMKKGLMAAGMAAGAAVSVVPILGGFLGQTLSQAAIDDAFRTEPEVYKVYEKHKGSAHDFDVEGANRSFYPLMLADLGLGQWETVNVGETALAQAAIDATANGAAAMLSVTWDGGGGHAVVVDETHGFLGTTYLCICDPWDGELRLVGCKPGGAVPYDGGSKPISLTFGGARHEYAAGANGRFNGWITRRK